MQLLADKAAELDCAFIATGHYARIEVDGEGLSHLLPAADAEADQSAALAGLPQEVLAKLVLPLGEFTKQKWRRCWRIRRNKSYDSKMPVQV